MKKICWLATGGTIASRPSENGLVPGFTAKEMLDMVPNLKDYAHIDCYDIMQLDSTNLQPEDWQYIAGYIENLYEHDDEHGFYGSASSNYWIEGVDCPCSIAGLNSTDEICGSIFGEDGEKITKLLENHYEFHECPWLCRCFDNKEGNRFGKWSIFTENVKHKARYFDHKEFKENISSVEFWLIV